ncbi:hypothetical protein IFO70_30355 [Phormidium tenue FACHB-886]|nr:hypothetical protein [Phormidium tenue FACHB-886]
MLASFYTDATQDLLELLSKCPPKVQTKLADIATNVEFDSELRVFHPNYQIFEPEQEVRERFLKLPKEAQHKQTLKHLRSFLYSAYYNGSLEGCGAPALSELVDSQTLKNESIIGIDVELFQKLDGSNAGSGYFDPGWLVKRQEPDGWIALSRGELTIHANPKLHLKADQQRLEVGKAVEVKMPKNCLQEGFYLAIGDAGPAQVASLSESDAIVRLYFNVTSAGAIALMQALTEQLNYSKTAFAFKVPYNYSNYGRFDAGVLYVKKEDYPTLFPVLQKVYQANSMHFYSEVPLFSKELAPGLGLAEEPNCKFELYESFGTNRCQILAMSLSEAKQRTQRSSEEKLALMLQYLSHFQVALEAPYLNGNSEDIYTVLGF